MFNENINAIAVKINNSYNEKMSAAQLYDVTRSAWKIDKEKRDKLKYVVAVYNGKIIDVFKVAAWVDAGTTMTSVDIVNADGRSEFVGNFADDKIRDKYKDRQLSEYAETTQKEFVYMTVEA